MPRQPILALSFVSDLAYAELAVELCCNVAHRMGFTDEECSDISMALRESVNNAVIHGNRNAVEKQVHVEFSAVPGRIAVTVRDEGRGFDPGAVPDPTAPENLMRPCGRGIFLMKHFMDTVAFRHRRPTGMEVTLERSAKTVSQEHSAPARPR